MKAPMNADFPPIAAEKSEERFLQQVRAAVGLDRHPVFDFIGGNRREIGVHRRFHGFSPALEASFA